MSGAISADTVPLSEPLSSPLAEAPIPAATKTTTSRPTRKPRRRLSRRTSELCGFPLPSFPLLSSAWSLRLVPTIECYLPQTIFESRRPAHCHTRGEITRPRRASFRANRQIEGPTAPVPEPWTPPAQRSLSDARKSAIALHHGTAPSTSLWQSSELSTRGRAM